MRCGVAARPKDFDVFALADGFIVMIGHRVQLTGSSESRRDYDDLTLHIEHSGTFYTFYDLLTQLDPGIFKQLDETAQQRFAKKMQGPPVHVGIPVKAGQVVGKIGGRSLDIAVVNSETRLKGRSCLRKCTGTSPGGCMSSIRSTTLRNH